MLRSGGMGNILDSLILTLCCGFRSRASLLAEILALRHRLTILKRSSKKRPRLGRPDRLLWVWLSRLWPDWRNSLLFVKPETVLAWHRKGFRLYWTWKSRRHRPGRPDTTQEIRDLVLQLQRPRVRGRSQDPSQRGRGSILGQDELGAALLALPFKEDREGRRQVEDEMNDQMSYWA
jgi:hypothetical protein